MGRKPFGAFKYSQLGFTLIELMVVLSIMGIIIGIVLIDFGSERANRNILIAQNQLASNIRKLQSYTLSSRGLDGGTPVQFYVLRVAANENSYQLQAIYDYLKTDPPKLATLETVRLPAGLQISQIDIENRPSPPASDSPACALLAFRTPFATVLMNRFCSINAPPVQGDDYEKIVRFATNGSGVSVSTDSKMTITLRDPGNDKCRQVEVYGISGKVAAKNCP